MSMSEDDRADMAKLEEAARFARELLDSHLWKSYLLPWLVSEQDMAFNNLMEHNVLPDATASLDLVAFKTQLGYLKCFKEKPQKDIEEYYNFQERVSDETAELKETKTGLPIAD